jgi:hypothetical protein
MVHVECPAPLAIGGSLSNAVRHYCDCGVAILRQWYGTVIRETRWYFAATTLHTQRVHRLRHSHHHRLRHSHFHRSTAAVPRSLRYQLIASSNLPTLGYIAHAVTIR